MTCICFIKHNPFSVYLRASLPLWLKTAAYFCNMNKDIADLRKDYRLQTLNEEDVANDAIEQFTRWWSEAIDSDIDEVNAITLATLAPDGMPSARIVLLKDYDRRGFVFFTNYNSAKGKAGYRER